MSENPFRSTAQMVADGTIRRPSHLDADSPFTGVAVTATPSVDAAATVVKSPVPAVLVKAPVAAPAAKKLKSGERGGRLMH